MEGLTNFRKDVDQLTAMINTELFEFRVKYPKINIYPSIDTVSKESPFTSSKEIQTGHFFTIKFEL